MRGLVGETEIIGGRPSRAFVCAEVALDIEVLGRLPVVGPREGDYAAVGADAGALVPVEDAAGGVLAGGDGGRSKFGPYLLNTNTLLVAATGPGPNRFYWSRCSRPAGRWAGRGRGWSGWAGRRPEGRARRASRTRCALGRGSRLGRFPSAGSLRFLRLKRGWPG